MSAPYNTYRSYLKSRFGKSVLRIPVNGGFSCPNRDGTKSDSGCTFCDNPSFSPVALDSSSVVSQLTTSIQRASPKFELFIAYLQPFTNTYGPVSQLKSIYESLINVPGVVGLAVGTRPDCLQEDTYDYLSDIADRTHLSMEIGLQSASNKTLAYNNRGHTFAEFESSVSELAKRKIETVAHVMIGLPGDTPESTLDTARKLAAMPVQGVKIHQLMIIKDTQMEKWYQQGNVQPLTLEEYAPIVSEFISLLRPDQHIHRIMADSKTEDGLIAPLWSSEKMESITYIRKYMEENNIKQGGRFKL
jgi:radical SAM protein (TIGR01212 family)